MSKINSSGFAAGRRIVTLQATLKATVAIFSCFLYQLVEPPTSVTQHNFAVFIPEWM
jgi:hypothetical protein